MRTSILYIALFIVAPFFANAQQNDDNAFAGSHDVFIYHGYEPASPAYPDSKGNTGFILQRRDKEGNSPWTTVNSFHSPQNAGELLDNYKMAMQIFPDNKSRFDAADAWGKWMKYKKYDSLANELAFAPGQIAFGIIVIDSTVKAGKTYQYRLLKNKEAAPVADNNVSNWVAYPAKINSPRPKFLHRRTESTSIMLDWFIKPGFSTGGFNVYRAAGNEKQFQLITQATFTMLHNDTLVYSIRDNKVASNQVYRYYIVPINAFGGGGNIVSDTISATVMDPQKLLPPQYIHAVADVKKRAVALHYILPNPGFMGSVHIMRSLNYENNYQEVGIVGPYDTVFNDLRITAGKKYYYYLLMTDKMGRNSTRSIKTFGLFQDNTNLFPARLVTAERTKRGIKISWQSPPDTAVVSGYYVCRRQGNTGKFERITTLLPLKQNSYLDTSKILRPATLYGYSVVSENLSNVVSDNSVIAYVTPQEASASRPWVTPRNVKAIADNNHVRLLWYDMRLLNKGMIYYNIYRRSDKDTVFKMISPNYLASFTSYNDTTTIAGLKYTYALEGADAAGHTSAQAVSNTAGIAMPIVKAPDIAAFSTTQAITITWEDMFEKRVGRYGIYRYVTGGQVEKIGEADASARVFNDKNVIAGTTYHYYLMPIVENTPLNPIASNKVYAILKEK
jgi:fibronectin type 3 domain-containing protein